MKLISMESKWSKLFFYLVFGSTILICDSCTEKDDTEVVLLESNEASSGLVKKVVSGNNPGEGYYIFTEIYRDTLLLEMYGVWPYGDVGHEIMKYDESKRIVEKKRFHCDNIGLSEGYYTLADTVYYCDTLVDNRIEKETYSYFGLDSVRKMVFVPDSSGMWRLKYDNKRKCN